MKIGTDQQYTYGDIKVNCAENEEDATKGWQAIGDGIILLNQNGSYVRRLVYLPQYLADTLDPAPERGWYDADDEEFTTCLNSSPLNFGEAVQVEASAGTGAKVTFAGQVKDSPTVVDVENTMAVANCSPVAIKLGDIVVNCSETEEDATKGWQAIGDGVILLNENGSYVRRLVYLPQYLADTLDPAPEKGWYDADDEEFTECWNDKMTIEAGGGIQVEAAMGTGATVSIKSALATDVK